jgi:hypothetical protein
MFPKLLAIVLCLGATGAGLLVIRQQRIEACHEMVMIHNRLNDHERTLWRLESEISQRCRPDAIRASMKKLNIVWTPIELDTVRPATARGGQLASERVASAPNPPRSSTR